jgi:hypothetical protein
MAAERRETPASFMYEPSFPPTIPPGLTIDDWRRRPPRRWGSRRLRSGPDDRQICPLRRPTEAQRAGRRPRLSAAEATTDGAPESAPRHERSEDAMAVVYSQVAPFSGAAYEYLSVEEARPTYREIAKPVTGRAPRRACSCHWPARRRRRSGAGTPPAGAPHDPGGRTPASQSRCPLSRVIRYAAVFLGSAERSTPRVRTRQSISTGTCLESPPRPRPIRTGRGSIDREDTLPSAVCHLSALAGRPPVPGRRRTDGPQRAQSPLPSPQWRRSH